MNFGPGDPLLAHKEDERCPVDQITLAYRALQAWLTREVNAGSRRGNAVIPPARST